MNEPTLLNQWPIRARLDVNATAAALGFMPHDIPLLMRARLLKPLGDPAPNAPKYFARCEVQRYADDVHWLEKATRAVSQEWRAKNKRRRQGKVGQAA